MEKAYRHLGYFFLLMIPLIAVAFHKNYGSKFPNFPADYDVLIHFHAFFASLWVLILISQPFLMRYKKLAWHRRIGKLSYFVFPLLVLSFIPGIMKTIDEGYYKYIFFPVADCLVLILMYVLAIYHRKTARKHMRYIIVSSLPLLGPTIGRIFPHYFGMDEVGAQTIQYAVTFSILIALVLYDRKHQRNYQPYMIGIYAFAAHAAVFYLLFAAI